MKQIRQVLDTRIHGATVLLVDDDENIQELFTLYLERMNFKVLLAPDGKTAIDLFQNHLPEIMLIILDQTLPDTSGYNIFRSIRDSSEDIPVSMTSGYSPDELSFNLDAEKNVLFLQKPCFRKDLQAIAKKATNVTI